MGASLALRLDDGLEGVEPLVRLGRVDVGELMGEPVEDHASSLAGSPTGSFPLREMAHVPGCRDGLAAA